MISGTSPGILLPSAFAQQAQPRRHDPASAIPIMALPEVGHALGSGCAPLPPVAPHLGMHRLTCITYGSECRPRRPSAPDSAGLSRHCAGWWSSSTLMAACAPGAGIGGAGEGGGRQRGGRPGSADASARHRANLRAQRRSLQPCWRRMLGEAEAPLALFVFPCRRAFAYDSVAQQTPSPTVASPIRVAQPANRSSSNSSS